MSSIHRPTRILALDPGTREIGFALFDGATLIRYGVRNLKKRLEKQSKGKIPGTELIESFKPNVLIIGKLTHPQRKKNPILKNYTSQVKLLASHNGIYVHEIEPSAARKFLNKDRQPTKMNVAALIVSTYPELSLYLPRKTRILWTHKDKYWMNMFDAFTLGLYYIRKSGKDVAEDKNSKRKSI
ncbi:MAG: hypothetical protein RIG61_00945 [Deltaproteobacteria bacterium]